MIKRTGAEETGTGYYTSKLMYYQRALHMSGNQMLSIMWEGATLQSRGWYLLIRLAVHLAPRGLVDDIRRLDRQKQRNVLRSDTEEEDEYNYPSVRTRPFGPGVTERHTDKVSKT